MKLLSKKFLDSKLVEKIMVIVYRYEASITLLENTKDVSTITLT